MMRTVGKREHLRIGAEKIAQPQPPHEQHGAQHAMLFPAPSGGRDACPSRAYPVDEGRRRDCVDTPCGKEPVIVAQARRLLKPRARRQPPTAAAREARSSRWSRRIGGSAIVKPCSRPLGRFSYHSVTGPRRYSTRPFSATRSAPGSGRRAPPHPKQHLPTRPRPPSHSRWTGQTRPPRPAPRSPSSEPSPAAATTRAPATSAAKADQPRAPPPPLTGARLDSGVARA